MSRRNNFYDLASVALCGSSVVLCVTIALNYTELHGEDTKLHRDFLKDLYLGGFL